MAKLKQETRGEGEDKVKVYVVQLSETEYKLAFKISETFNLHGHVSEEKLVGDTLGKAAEFASGFGGSVFLDFKPVQAAGSSPKTKPFAISDKCAAELEKLSDAFNMGERETSGAVLEMYRLMGQSKKQGKLTQAGTLLIVE